MNAMHADPFPPPVIILRRQSQNRPRLPRVSSGHASCRNQEIVMAPSHNAHRTASVVCAAASSLAVLSWSAAAFAAQGPGASQGTAGASIQLAMAVLVYGAAALVIGAGLIGAVRRH
jgi:hypothetical protein